MIKLLLQLSSRNVFTYKVSMLILSKYLILMNQLEDMEPSGVSNICYLNDFRQINEIGTEVEQWKYHSFLCPLDTVSNFFFKKKKIETLSIALSKEVLVFQTHWKVYNLSLKIPSPTHHTCSFYSKVWFRLWKKEKSTNKLESKICYW